MQRIIPLLLVLIVLIVAALSCLFVVDQRQYAVVFAFGEIRKVIDEPGLNVKWPPPFQNVQYFDKRILTIDNSDIDRFITSEKLNVQIDTFVKWRITDPRTFIRSVSGSEALAADRIMRSLRDALNNEIAKRTVSDVISGERDAIVNTVRERIDADARQIGISVIDVRLKRVDFAPEVQERVFDRMQSERKRVANERRATGTAESEKVRADADRQREVILAGAYRDAQKIQGQGDAAAAAIYAEAYSQNPDFAEFYRSLDAYRASFRSRSDLLVVDPSAEFFKYLTSSGSASAAGVRK